MSRFLAALVAHGLVTVGLVLAIPAGDLVRGTALVVRAANLHGRVQDAVASVDLHHVTTEALRVPTRHGAIKARLYRPGTTWRRTILLTPGVHAEGIDEPRLVGFAGDLAQSGLGVLTVELPDLLEYRITPRLPDQIEDAAAWLLDRPDFARDGRVGLVGISFAGGLSVVAAGRERIRDHVAYVMAFGGHGDLQRTLRYLCTGIQADGVHRPPHDYGLVVVLLNLASSLVPSEQVDGLRAGINLFMRASHVDMVDHGRALQIFGEAVALEPSLPEPSRSLLHAVNTRDVTTLGRVLLPAVERTALPASVSPATSPPPRAPVFLLHGADDNVVPAIESQLLGDRLRREGVDVRVQVTPLITHAEVDRPPTVPEVWKLVRFWGAMLAR